MSRLRHPPRPGLAGWISLGLFVAVYLSTLALVLVPGLAEGIHLTTLPDATDGP